MNTTCVFQYECDPDSIKVIYTGLNQKETDIVRQLDIDEQTRKRIHARKEKITQNIYIMP